MRKVEKKTGVFVRIGETNSPNSILVVDTQVTDILFGLAFLEKFKSIF